jgi:hypothetical protein
MSQMMANSCTPDNQALMRGYDAIGYINNGVSFIAQSEYS